MPDETTQSPPVTEPTQQQVVTAPTPPEPEQLVSEPTSAPVATQSPTEPTASEPVNLEKPLEAPPVATEGPTSPSIADSGQTLESPISAPTTQVEPPATAHAPQSIPVLPQPAAPAAVVPTPRSFLSKALAVIQFRKQAKLAKILKLAAEKKTITNDQVEKLLRVSDATASRYLAQLVRDGKLQKIGKDGSSRYELVSR